MLNQLNNNTNNLKNILDNIDNLPDESKLPKDYTQVEYIESTGTQYINTNYRFTSEKIQLILDLVNTNTNNSVALCGSENSSSSGINGVSNLILYSSSGSTNEKFAIEHANGSTGITLDLPVQNRFLINILADTGNLTVSVNGTVQTGTYTGYSEKVYPFALFADMKDGDAVLHSKYRLYACKIYDNDILVRDFVPCYDSDGVAGLYDLVNEIFYTNAGTGDFLVPSTPTLLWTNPNPTSTFAAQTINLPTGYGAYMIEYKRFTNIETFGIAYCSFSTDAFANFCTVDSTDYSTFFVGREIASCIDGSISFGDKGIAHYYNTDSMATGSGAGGTGAGIPTRIWGLKWTL